MKRTSALAGLGINAATDGPSEPSYPSTPPLHSHTSSQTASPWGSPARHRSNSQHHQHMRQQSLTSACLPASSPDLTKRGPLGSRLPNFFDSSASSAGSASSSSKDSIFHDDGRSRSKRSLPLRLLQLGYLSFALVYTTSTLLGLTGQKGQGYFDAAQKYIPAQAVEQLPLERMNDAWQAVREKMPFQEIAHAVAPPPASDPVAAHDWSTVARSWHQPGPENNPLSPYSHAYRFSKLHSKLASQAHDQMTPFAYHASSDPRPEEVTACMYTNQAWLDFLPHALTQWSGPVSLVVETLHPRESHDYLVLLDKIKQLREDVDVLKRTADIHIVTSVSPNMTHLLTEPVASNAHINLARFFARTDAVVLLPDARLIPSFGLHKRLVSEPLASLLDAGDAVIIPTFAPLRGQQAMLPTPPKLSTNQELGLVSAEEDAQAFVQEHLDTLHTPLSDWPARKAALVTMSTPTADNAAPGFGLFDRSWDLNLGPTNFALWSLAPFDPQLELLGAGLASDGGVGGGHTPYVLQNTYDLHYAPLIAMKRDGHPWCNERFDRNAAACGYATWLTGAKFWIVPDEWVYTLEAVERPKEELSDAEQLRTSIASRLYTKYHAEACMHFGREFLSKGLWETEQAGHLREACGKVLGSWGMGILESES